MQESKSTTDSPDRVAGASDYFATTRWTIVVAAGQRSAPEADRALEDLCSVYWYPLYVYVRSQGFSKQDAEDLTQGFFARFLKRNYLEGLSAAKGKFRAFLLAALKHFMLNERDRNSRQKRGGGNLPLSLDWRNADERYQIEQATALSPDKLYDRTWAILLLEQVLQRLENESTSETNATLYTKLRPFLMVGKSEIPYSQVATELGWSEGALRVAVHRLRRRYRELLRLEISQTLADPAQVEEEMQALFHAFSS